MEPEIARKPHIERRAVRIPAEGVVLNGDLAVPEDPSGLVIFAHGTGSSRLSPRNRAVAHALNRANMATLLMDLLTAEEETIDLHTAHLRFDIDLLANRLLAATDWARSEPDVGRLRVGYFGASTGAAAALVAAAKRPVVVHAVVSRGGRPDLAKDSLPLVRAPTLLIVGENDHAVIPLNEQALVLLKCKALLELVPRATHLFEEAGALERVSELARQWFEEHLPV